MSKKAQITQVEEEIMELMYGFAEEEFDLWRPKLSQNREEVNRRIKDVSTSYRLQVRRLLKKFAYGVQMASYK